MRICLDIRTETKGGPSTFVENFLYYLINEKNKHEFLFLTNRKYDKISHSLFDIVKTPTKNPILQVGWVQAILPNILNTKKIQIYHSLKHLGPIFCSTKSIYRIAAIGQFCGIYPLNFPDRLYWTYLEKILIKRADIIIAVSNYIKNFVLEHFKISDDRVITVYNGIDDYFQHLSDWNIDEKFLSKKEIKDRFILCVGNIVPVKNHETAIKAYWLLKEEAKIDNMLVIAGATHYPHFLELQNLVAKLRLQDSVKFLGYQSKQELRELYNHAEILVHPSLHEGLSFTILEAMACGLPIVTSKVTSNPELAGDAAVYYDNAKDFDELAYRMKTLLDSRDLQEAISEKALLRARQFSWPRCVQETLAVYDKV